MPDPGAEALRRYYQRSEWQYPWLSLAKVVGRHPDRATVDVVMTDGGVWTDVPILAPLSGGAGHQYIPYFAPTAPTTTEAGSVDLPVPGDNDLWAVVGYLGGNSKSAVVLGFLRPLTSQLYTQTPGMEVSLHESGVWSIVTPDGATEWHWPDGSYVRVGTTTTPHDMTKENAAWNPPTISAKELLTASLASGVQVQIDGSGNVALSTPSSLTIKAGGAVVEVSSSGAVTVTPASGETVTLAGGTKGVARVGDSVQVSGTDSHGDTFTATGTITSGSSIVLAG